jgi:hypothetical protein
MKSLLAAALVICFAAQSGKALAYACNNIYYVNSSGHLVHSPSCGQKHEKRTAECRDGSVSFSEHHRGACSHHGGVAHWASARRSVRAESPLRCIWIQSYAFGSANLHDQSLIVLT